MHGIREEEWYATANYYMIVPVTDRRNIFSLQYLSMVLMIAHLPN